MHNSTGSAGNLSNVASAGARSFGDSSHVARCTTLNMLCEERYGIAKKDGWKDIDLKSKLWVGDD